MVWSCFSWLRLGPLFPVKGNLNTTAYDILDNSMLPTFWQQFEYGPFLFHHDNAPVHKARSIQKWFVEIGVEGLDWVAQSPDLDCDPGLIVQHLLPDLTNALVAEWKQVPAAMFQHLVESLPRRVNAVISANGPPNVY